MIRKVIPQHISLIHANSFLSKIIPKEVSVQMRKPEMAKTEVPNCALPNCQKPGRPGTGSVNITQCKFYTMLFFKHFDWMLKKFNQSKCLKK